MEKKDTIWMEKFIKILKDEKNNEVKVADVKKFLQPTMRFKPRTDLERIYETINSVYYGSVKKDGVNKQLKFLQLNEPDLEISFEEEIPDYNLAYIKKAKQNQEEEERMNVYNIKSVTDEIKKKSLYNPTEALGGSKQKPKKEIKKPKRKFVDNSEARALRKELYNKTHFKATTDFSIFKSNLNLITDRNRNIKG
jgi:hypothetical protein